MLLYNKKNSQDRGDGASIGNSLKKNFNNVPEENEN